MRAATTLCLTVLVLSAAATTAAAGLFDRRSRRPAAPVPGLAPQESLRPYFGKTPEQIHEMIEVDVYGHHGVEEGERGRDRRRADSIVRRRYDSVMNRLGAYRNLPIPHIQVWQVRMTDRDRVPRGSHLSDARQFAVPVPAGPRLEVLERQAMRRYVGEPEPIELGAADRAKLEEVVRAKVLAEEGISKFSAPGDRSRAEALIPARVDRALQDGTALDLLGR